MRRLTILVEFEIRNFFRGLNSILIRRLDRHLDLFQSLDGNRCSIHRQTRSNDQLSCFVLEQGLAVHIEPRRENWSFRLMLEMVE